MIWKFLGGIKAYLSIGLGLLVAGLVALTKYQSGKIDRLKDEVDEHEVVLENKDKIAKADKKTKERTESRRAEARNEVKKPKHSDSTFSDPNKLRGDKKGRTGK